MIAPLKKRLPACKIVALHVDSVFRGNAGKNSDIAAWYPDSPMTIQDFLAQEIPETPASSIKIIEWRPALNIYGEKYVNALSEAADFIKRSDAQWRTAAVYGRRWLRNFFKNLAILSDILMYKPDTKVVIVSGSGPGLETLLPRIREMRSRALILASSSSLLALRRGGICPDLVISTDGGAWALCHLYPCIRHTMPIRGIALNLCAALPSQCAGYPLLILNDGSLWQTLVLSALGIPSLVTGQRGTVTASAVEAALELSTGPVFMAGVDLSNSDIRTHARPYGFDHLLYGAANRLNPLYGQYFRRAYGISGGQSLNIYASWFKNNLPHWPKRIFTLDTKSSVFEKAQEEIVPEQGAISSYQAEAQTAAHNEFLHQIRLASGKKSFSVQAADILIHALEDPRYAEPLHRELSALLFHGVREVTAGMIAGELDKIGRHYITQYTIPDPYKSGQAEQ